MKIKEIILQWIRLMLIISIVVSCDYKKEPIKIGVLHSLTGTMSFSERDLVDAVTLAVEQINASGGVLDRPLKMVVADGASNWGHFASEADRLLSEEHVPVIFGCWTSACRKAVKPVVEKHNNLLFYPLQYEGLEQSPNIVYTGAAPNQQIVPSIQWALENLGKRVYLVGSDYIFPYAANMIIKDLLKQHQVEPLGESYLPLGSTNIATVISEIRKLKPDLILNTINGDTNIAFFSALQPLDKIKVLSYSIAEPEVKRIGIELLVGHYAAWNYFQSINSADNLKFVAAFKQRFGQDRLVNDPMEAAYTGVYLWAQSARTAGSVAPTNIRSVLGQQSLKAPEGIVSIDATSQHLWRTVRIGQVQENGQFKIVWSTETPVRPVPFPSYRSKDEWIERLDAVKKEGNH